MALILIAYGAAYIGNVLKAKKEADTPLPADEPVSHQSEDPQSSDGKPTDEDIGDAIVDYAMQLNGSSYLMGGTDPSTGFDCSGLVYYVLNKTGHDTKARTSTELYHTSTIIDDKELMPGDLVFFTGTYGKAEVTHVGIFIGDGRMIHAGDESSGVCIADLSSDYWVSHFLAYGRIR